MSDRICTTCGRLGEHPVGGSCPRAEPLEPGVTIYQTTEHAPVDVPHVLLKRDLADALHKALEEKLFDEIGIVQDTPKGDPVLVGRVLSPKARNWNREGVAFFIGWWFDPKVLNP